MALAATRYREHAPHPALRAHVRLLWELSGPCDDPSPQRLFPHDGKGGIVAPGDLERQVEQAFINVGHALEAAGARFADVAKTTIYVTKWSIDQMPQFGAGFARAAQKLGITTKPPASLIGVEVLFHPDVRVEIEVTVVTQG